MTNEERSREFNETTGCISWGGRDPIHHPHACVCQGRPDNFPGTPHKHYDEPPFACARCGKCQAYRPRFVLDLAIPGLAL